MNPIFRSALAASIALACSSVFAADLRLLSPAANDQVPARLIASKSRPNATLDRTPATFSWSLDVAEKLAAPQPYAAESREYWTEAEAGALAKGIALHSTVKGAVIRVSPVQAEGAKALRAESIAIRQRGKAVSANAIATTQVAQEFEAVGAPMPAGSLAFRLGDGVGTGAFELAIAGGRGRYLVHVFEPGSSEKLVLAAHRASAVAGDRITVSGRYDGALAKRLGRVSAIATSPSGDAVPLEMSVSKDGTFTATFDAKSGGGAHGLWEIHAFATTDDGSVQRDAKTAVAIATPSAKFNGAVKLDAGDKRPGLVGAPRATFGIDVASASRYDVSAVLHATDANGVLVPAAIAHSAAWLEPGSRALRLTFDEKTLRAAGLGRPFEIRDLTLTNHAEIAVIEKRARALSID